MDQPLTPVSAKLRDTGGRLLAIRPRNLTLDSDVTSLLQQKPDTKALGSQVQVVRGHASKNVVLGGSADAAATKGATGMVAAEAPGSAPQN